MGTLQLMITWYKITPCWRASDALRLPRQRDLTSHVCLCFDCPRWKPAVHQTIILYHMTVSCEGPYSLLNLFRPRFLLFVDFFQESSCNGCHHHAVCISSKCTCRQGYSGDGKICRPSKQPTAEAFLIKNCIRPHASQEKKAQEQVLIPRSIFDLSFKTSVLRHVIQGQKFVYCMKVGSFYLYLKNEREEAPKYGDLSPFIHP